MGVAGLKKKRGATIAPRDFYRRAAQALLAADVPFLVGGAFALSQYTSVVRDTKDLDVFVRPAHARAALEALARAGYRTDMTFPHWLGKAHCEESFVDIIFSSGNGVAVVDDGWFSHARTARVLDLDVQICPPEEILWSKAFILERERFDGADVNHLLRDCAPDLDWKRLLSRFGEHWRVLLAHLVLFGYVYPGERDRVPSWVTEDLAGRFAKERKRKPPPGRVCQGTLLSREQYLLDVQHLGYDDPRITNPDVHMTKKDVVIWTRAIPGKAAKTTPSTNRSPARAKAGDKRRSGR